MRDRLYYTDTTDEQWGRIGPVINAWKAQHPSVSGHDGMYDMRDIVDAIFYQNRAGCPWSLVAWASAARICSLSHSRDDRSQPCCSALYFSALEGRREAKSPPTGGPRHLVPNGGRITILVLPSVHVTMEETGGSRWLD